MNASRLLLCAPFLLLFACVGCTTPDTPLTRIAFGSCNRQGNEQPLWTPIRAADPDLWIWLGDNIYADTEEMTAMDSLYAVQKQNPGYRALREEVPVIGTSLR